MLKKINTLFGFQKNHNENNYSSYPISWCQPSQQTVEGPSWWCQWSITLSSRCWWPSPEEEGEEKECWNLQPRWWRSTCLGCWTTLSPSSVKKRARNLQSWPRQEPPPPPPPPELTSFILISIDFVLLLTLWFVNYLLAAQHSRWVGAKSKVRIGMLLLLRSTKTLVWISCSTLFKGTE